MNKWAFAFLAMGDEHIREFNIVSSRINELFPEVDIIVASDTPDKINSAKKHNVVSMDEGIQFNYNLKRIPIVEALKRYSTILYLDTDTWVREKWNIQILNDIEGDGIWVDDIIPPERQSRNGSIEWIQPYITELTGYYGQTPLLVPEGRMIIRIENPQTQNEFFTLWEQLHNQTLSLAPQQYGLNGAMEGFIIWICAQKCGIPIHRIWETPYRKLYECMVHYGTRDKKLIPTMV